MTAYFLDSSACVKLYVEERGTAWLRSLVSALTQHEFIIVRVAVIETAAALYRRAHVFTHDFEEARAGVAALQRDVGTLFRAIEVSPNVVALALQVAAGRHLRGYDCLQLAGALYAERARTAASLSRLVLLSSDSELMAAAGAEGFRVENPDEH